MFAFARILLVSFLLLFFAALPSTSAKAQENELDSSSFPFMANDIPEAKVIQQLKGYLQVDSNHIQSWIMLGGLWENMMQYDSAAFAYHKALTVDKTCLRCKQQLANVLANQGKVGKALTLYEEGLMQNSSNTTMRSQYARLLKRDSRFLKAFSQFKLLLENDTLNAYLWEQFGDCALKSDSGAIALKAYNTSFELNPANMPLAIKLINGFIDVGIPPMFIMPISDIAYKQDSAYVPLLRTKGYLHFLAENYENAEAWFEKGYSAGDSSRFTLKFLGICKYQVGDFLEATSILERAFEKDTTDNALNFILAKAYTKVGDWKKTVDLLDLTQKLLTPDPKEIAALYSVRAEAYTKSSQFMLAAEQYQIAFELHSEYNAYLFEAGMCYYFAKEYEASKTKFEIFLSNADVEEPRLRSTSDRINSAKRFLKKVEQELFFIDS